MRETVKIDKIAKIIVILSLVLCRIRNTSLTGKTTKNKKYQNRYVIEIDI